MSIPNVKVLMGFRTGGGGSIVMTDVTTYVQTVTTNRGRSRQLQEFNAGTASISLWNKSRAFDPLNTASPYWNTTENITSITPRIPIQILSSEIPIFTGLVTDWNIDYDLGNNDIAIVNCSDNFTILANNEMQAHTVSEEISSARVSAVLGFSEVAYTGSTSITTGSSILGGTAADADFSIADGTVVLNYLQTVATSEQGFLFMSATGVLTFKGRTSVLNKPAGANFNGDGTGIPFNSLENEYGDELLYNYIATQSPAGAEQIAQSAASIALYQTQTYTQNNLLNSTVNQVTDLGLYLLGKYKFPVLRFKTLSTQMMALSDTNKTICLNMDLTSICSVTKNFQQGSPSSSTQDLIVSGISHNITPSSHIIQFTFESADRNQYLTLSDLTFGRLDYNLLSF